MKPQKISHFSSTFSYSGDFFDDIFLLIIKNYYCLAHCFHGYTILFQIFFKNIFYHCYQLEKLSKSLHNSLANKLQQFRSTINIFSISELGENQLKSDFIHLYFCRICYQSSNSHRLLLVVIILEYGRRLLNVGIRNLLVK